MTALDELALHYRDRARAARAWRRADAAVVGYVGTNFPVELALAAGLLPVRLWGDPTASTTLADNYTPEFDHTTRSILQRLLDGTFDFLDLLVIDHSSEANAMLFASLREIERVERVPSLPPVAFFDRAHLARPSSHRYNARRADELAARLASLAGRVITDEARRSAAALRARQRELLDRIADLRTQRPARLSGTDALRVIGAGLVMAPAEHCALLARLIADPPSGGHSEARLFVTGSGHDQTGYYEAIERSGAVVVGEDHAWGDGAWHGTPLPRGIVERAAHVTERAIATGADAVVALILSGDAASPWQVPEMRRRLDAVSIPLLSIDHLPYAASEDLIATKLAAFLAVVRPDPDVA